MKIVEVLKRYAASLRSGAPTSEEYRPYWGVDELPEFQRILAQRVLQRVDQQQQFAFDQVGSMAKWLMASLLAVNGGGAIAAMNVDGGGGPYWLAGLLFAIGILSALVSGVTMQDVYNSIPGPLLEVDNYWTGVGVTGERDSLRERELRSGTTKALRFSVLPPLFGWLSGLLFIGGAITIAFNNGDDQRYNAARCLALQKDILSARPRRPDGIELFKALGCSPTGNGSVFAPPRA